MGGQPRVEKHPASRPETATAYARMVQVAAGVPPLTPHRDLTDFVFVEERRWRAGAPVAPGTTIGRADATWS